MTEPIERPFRATAEGNIPLTDEEMHQRAADLAEARAALPAALWAVVKAARDKRKSEGGYLVAGKWFHSDADSRTQQLGLMTLVLMGQTLPGTPWKTMDGTYMPMTNALAAQVFAAAVALDTTIFTHAETLRAAINAAADPLTVDLGGWPQAFYDL